MKPDLNNMKEILSRFFKSATVTMKRVLKAVLVCWQFSQIKSVIHYSKLRVFNMERQLRKVCGDVKMHSGDL